MQTRFLSPPPSTPEPLPASAEPDPAVRGRGAGTDRLLVVGAMASSLLRDMRDMLGAVLGFAQLLAGETSPASAAGEYVRHIARAGAHGDALAQRLLVYAARPASGPERVDLRGVVDCAVELVGPLLGRHIRLKVEHGAGDLSVLADAVDLEQVVLALVLNARDAMPAGGRLTLGTRRVDGGDAGGGSVPHAVELLVHDTGLCLAADALAEESARSTGGWDLRLLCDLVQRNGGSLDSHSNAAQGTHFRVLLPFAA